MRKLFRRLSYFWNRRQAERDLADEMSAHREQLEPGRATAFGSALRLREESRDVWGFAWLDQLSQDLRYGVRSLAKSRGFTLAATLILTLGVGLNLTFFQLLNATTLQPIPLKDLATLVRFIHRAQGKGGNMTSSTVWVPTAEYVRDHNTILSAAIFEQTFDLAWGEDAAERVRASFVTVNWFEELGYGAALGRVFHATVDDSPSAAPGVVLSDRFWRTHLGADPAVVGATVRINNRPVAVIGVAPASFPGMRQQTTDLWLPMGQGVYFNSPVTAVNFYARVHSGLSAAAVREATRAPMAAALEQGLSTMPDSWLEPRFGTERFEPPNDARQRWSIAALVGGLTLLVLLVACANLSNLLLSRAMGRVLEFGMRTALGASRWRIVRQLLTECLLLACLGTVGGSVVAYGAGTWISRAAGDPMNFAPDWRTVSAAAGLALFTMFAVGFLPALKISRQDLTVSMKDGGQNASSGMDRTRLRQMLLGMQVAGSCLLLVLAGMALQSLQTVLASGPGFDFRRFAVMDVSLSRDQIEGAEAAAFWSNVKRNLQLLPQTESIALSGRAPLGDSSEMSMYRAAPGLSITNERVEADFFQAMRIPILAGRNFSADDAQGQNVILSRNLAVALFGSPSDAIGKIAPSRETVIGVAGDTNLARIIDPNSAQMYRPLRPEDLSRAILLVRARSDPSPLLTPIRQAARTADVRVLAGAHLMAADYEARLTVPRLVSNVGLMMALLALTLACLGVFGVVSYGAAMRTKEIGIRRALGASGNSVVAILLRQLIWPVVGGVVLGGSGAAALAKVLAGAPLYLTAFNATVFGFAIAFLAVTAAVAALLPALRALGRDPLEALRYE